MRERLQRSNFLGVMGQRFSHTLGTATMEVEAELLASVEGFFNGWQAADWKEAAKWTQVSRRLQLLRYHNEMSDQLTTLLAPKKLSKWEVMRSESIGSLRSEVIIDMVLYCEYTIQFKNQPVKKEVQLTARFVRESTVDGAPSSLPGSLWGVNDISLLREIEAEEVEIPNHD